MEIYEKVRKYLYENIGHLATAGTPRYDLVEKLWKVPVLCKTERGIIIVGEFLLDNESNFVNIPTDDWEDDSSETPVRIGAYYG